MRELMNQSIRVYRQTTADDGIGGFKPTLSYRHTIVGFISRRNVVAKEREKAGQTEVEVTHDFFCMPDQDVKRKDVLEYDGRRYLVVAISPAYDALTGTAHHMEGELSEIQEG